MPSNTKSKAARIPCGKCGGYVEEKRRLPGLSPDSRLTVYFSTLLLPRMVASGLAACFMNADGLMPTMFLNCLEKWYGSCIPTSMPA